MKNKSIIVGITLLAVFILAIWFLVFPLAINKEAAKNALKANFETATGMKLEIQGEAVLKMSPLPYLSIDSLYVLNPATTKSPFFLKIKNVAIWPVFGSLLNGQIAIRKIQISGVDIDVEVANGAKPNWQEISKYWSEGAFKASNIKPLDHFSGVDVVINDGHLDYSDSKTGFVSELSNINTAFTIDAQGKANAEVRVDFQNKPYVISGQIKGELSQIFSSGAAPVELQIANGQNKASYAGNIGYKDNNAVFNGDLRIDTDDFSYWVNLYNHGTANTDAPSYKKLPLVLSAKVVMEDSAKVTLKDVTLDGGVIKGNAQVSVNLPDQVDIKSVISKLNLEDIIENGVLIGVKPVAAVKVTTSRYDTVAQRTANSVNISSDVKIEDIIYNNKHITNTSFYVDMTGDEMTVPQFLANLPGDTILSFSGIGHSASDGLSLEGQIDAQGNSIIQALSLFKSNSFTLPPEDFKRFHLRANTLVSSKEVRLSELVARIEGVTINGGLSAKFHERTNIQAALGIHGLNLDHISTLWGLENLRSVLLNKDQMGDRSDGVMSVWLKRLGYDMLISASLDKYTLNGKLYDKANLNIGATEGKIEIGGNKIAYNDSLVSGKVRIDVSKNVPVIDLHAFVDQFDLARLFPASTTKVQAGAGGNQNASRWSADLLDFGWFELLSGTYDVVFGHLKYGDVDVDDVSLSGTLSDQKLNIENFKATIFGALAYGKAYVTGGAIPTFSIAADIGGLRIEKLSKMFPFLGGVSGICNANMNLSTNGVNKMSWIGNLQGTIGMRGRDIEVRGFNLPGIIRAVAYVRTVADILNVVKRAVPSGNTTFSAFEGQWNVVKGVLATADAKIINDQAEGTMVSRIDFANWTDNTSITFILKTLDPVNAPSMTTRISGDIDDPNFDFDTRALEQYVNNKTSEKMLQDYGAH